MKPFSLLLSLFALSQNATGACINKCAHKHMQCQARTTSSTYSPVPTPPPSQSDVSQVAKVSYIFSNTFSCYETQATNLPLQKISINPELLGNVSSEQLCGKTMLLDINGYTFSGTIVDTCSNTTETTCGINLYNQEGIDFLQISTGDDFYQGPVRLELV